MNQSVLRTYARNLDYARRLVADVPPEKMAAQPAPGMNHAAWVLGHLVFTCDVIGKLIGLAPAMPEPWLPIFNNESRPSDDPTIYPDKLTLLAALERGHTLVADALAQAPATILEQPLPNENYRTLFPTIGDILVYLTTAHEAVHLGQLSAWRRAQGLPSV